MSDDRTQYGAKDCEQTGYAMPISNKVIVVRSDVLPADHPNQLFLCTGGFGSNPNPSGRAVFAVSLSTGEHCRWNRGDVVGTLKPELLPDEAKLYLSQIRPGGATDVKDPEYSGYCYLEDGRYSAGVWLRDPEEAVEYAAMQAPYQHRVQITDRDDFTVAEIQDGKLLHPSSLDEFDDFGEQKQNGGMTMT